jgi:hypothetical protein
MKNIEGEIRYHRIKLRNIRVTQDKPLTQPYFTNIQIGEGEEQEIHLLNTGEYTES